MALSLERLLQNAHDLGFEYEETCISDTNPIRQLKQLHSCRSEIEKLSTEIEQRKWFLQNPKPSVYSQLGTLKHSKAFIFKFNVTPMIRKYEWIYWNASRTSTACITSQGCSDVIFAAPIHWGLYSSGKRVSKGLS